MGIEERKLLCDHAAHRNTDEVNAIHIEVIDEVGDIAGKLRHVIRAFRRIAEPNATIVEPDRAVRAGDQRRDL